MARLTQAVVERLPGRRGEAGERAEQILWDGELKGFGLRLLPSGRGTWIVQYRAGKRQRRISLGNVATVLAGEARARARELLARSDLGHDPQAERHAAKLTLTVRELIMLYLERQARPRLKSRSLVEVERHLLVKAKALHSIGVAEVGRVDVARLLVRIADEAPVQANRVRASLSALFAWSMTQGLMQANPVIGTAKPTSERARERVLTIAELVNVWRHAGDEAYGAIIRLMILTACRRTEAGSMTLGEVDRDGLWRVPAERSKNGIAIERRLPAAATDGLRKWFDGVDADTGFVFGKGGKRPFQDWSRAKAHLDERLGRAGPKEWTLHDLRRSVATHLGELEMAPPHVVEALLGHRHERVGSAHAVYNRARYRAEVGRALAAWAEHLMAEVEGPSSAVAKVVPVRGRS